MSEQLAILYRDDALIAVHKPPGLLVHRSDIDRHETRFAVQLLRDQTGQHVYPVHRLDKPTSGVLLFATSAAIARTVVAAFADHRVHKEYWAVVRGHPPASGRIDHPLRRIEDDYAGPVTAEQAQPASTAFRALAKIELPVAIDRYPASRYALLQLAPETGRQHQLRRHLKHIAHPIIGDVRYGKGNHNRYFREQLGVSRLLLACVAMRLDHPVTGVSLCIEQPVDGDFQALLQRWQFPLRTVPEPDEPSQSCPQLGVIDSGACRQQADSARPT